MEVQTIPSNSSLEVLSGETLNHLNEIAPRLIRDLGDRAGMTISDLRKMAEEGKLTSALLMGSARPE